LLNQPDTRDGDALQEQIGMRSFQAGFTLIELLIVVAIIALAQVRVSRNRLHVATYQQVTLRVVAHLEGVLPHDFKSPFFIEGQRPHISFPHSEP
jgi:prepilin-type N-terminal cleavage/methylation domain-containing protein